MTKVIRSSFNKELKGDVFVPEKSNRKTIVFLGGLPSYFYKNEISQVLAEQGFTMIQPFYYGTWVSGGSFNPTNCFKTLEDTVLSLQKGEVQNLYSDEKLEIDVNEYYVMGTSFGSVVVQAYEGDLELRNRIVLAGIPFFNKYNNESIKFDGDHLVDFVQRGFEYVYRSQNWDEWRNEFRGEGKYLNRVNSEAKYLFIQGDQDSIGTQLVMEKYISDHALKGQMVVVQGSHSLDSINALQVSKGVLDFIR